MALEYEKKYLEFRKKLRILEEESRIREDFPEYDRIVVGFLLWNIVSLVGKELEKTQRDEEIKRRCVSARFRFRKSRKIPWQKS